MKLAVALQLAGCALGIAVAAMAFGLLVGCAALAVVLFTAGYLLERAKSRGEA